MHFFMTPIILWLNCAQIVPAMVKCFQMVPNETKKLMLNYSRAISMSPLFSIISSGIAGVIDRSMK